jgi:hypothetical protein
MVPNRASRSVFSVLVLLAALVLASVPAQSQPVRRPLAGSLAVAASGENSLSRLWRSLVNLMKEGTSIDPDGKHGAGVTVNPTSGGSDEGTSIDPNGRQ